MKKKDTKGMGHNNPPKELADLTNEQGRVRINKESMALLKPVPDSNDPEGKKYLEADNLTFGASLSITVWPRLYFPRSVRA